MDAPSLEIVRLNDALSNVSQLKISLLMAGRLDEMTFKRSLPTQTILYFY